MNNSEYLAQFNEKDVINVFGEIIKADAPSTSFIDRDVDIIDVDYYIDPVWGLWNGEIAHIMEIVNEKINS